jgi:hypothetical protein
MTRIRTLLLTAHSGEEGHALPAVGSLVGGIGAILLGIGAANDSGGLAVAGGIVAAVGIIGGALLEHMKIDYDIYGRLEKLEKK